MIFPLFVKLYVVQKCIQLKFYYYIYKLSSDDKTLSSLIKKAWYKCIFLNYFKETNEK